MEDFFDRAIRNHDYNIEQLRKRGYDSNGNRILKEKDNTINLNGNLPDEEDFYEEENYDD